MNDLKEELAIERYKFILAKIQHLDESLYKNIGFVAKFVTAIISAVASILVLLESKKIANEIAMIIINLLSYISAFTCLLFIFFTLAIMFSWYDYRKEEVELLNRCEADLGRKAPSFKGVLRWTETWFLIALLIIGIISLNLELILGAL